MEKLTSEQIHENLQIVNNWEEKQSQSESGEESDNYNYIEKEFNFNNFKEALDFTNKVGQVAESLNHHPGIFLTWGLVKITIWTHSESGLTENDFMLASKIDKLA